MNACGLKLTEQKTQVGEISKYDHEKNWKQKIQKLLSFASVKGWQAGVIADIFPVHAAWSLKQMKALLQK